MPFPVQSAMIGILQDPHFEYALARVKIRHSPINVQENRLDNLLGFAWIADDSECYVENKMVIAVKEGGDGVLAADCHTLHELFIGELTEVFGLQPKRLGEAHYRSTSLFLWGPNHPAPIHISITQLQDFAWEFI